MADAFEAAYREKQKASQMRRVMSDIHADLFGTPLESFTFGKYVKKWLPRAKGEYEPSTFERIEGTISAVMKIAPELFAQQIDRIERSALIDLRNQLAESRAKSTVKTMMSLLKSIFRSAWQDGLISANPAGSIPQLKSGGVESAGEGRRAFTPAELKKVLAEANPEWRGMIYVGLYAGGQRIGDVSRMTAGQVDLKSGVIKFQTQKTKRWVILPIAAPLLPVLKPLVDGLGANDPVFPVANKRASKQIGMVSNAFRQLLYKAGLATHPKKTKAEQTGGRRTSNGLSFHSLRHTATSLLMRAGVSRAVVMDIVGHDSETVSENYTNIDENTKRLALDQLPDIGAT
jgi:integrase